MTRAYAIAIALFLVAGCDGQHNLGSVEHGSKQVCGGASGATCPLHEVCIDDPNDSCDPATGSSCAGTCRKPTGPQCSPDLPADAVCALILCGGGYQVVDGKTTCACCDTCPPVVCAIACAHGFKKDAAGCNVCQCEDPPPACQGPNPKGCATGGCPAGQKCDLNAGCGPSACSCDAATGGWICTADCGGGTCVPDPQACGDKTCPTGQVCCNASCGICTPPGGACIQIACDNRTPASGQCVRNSNDSCTSDSDCKPGGCGGELCYNPAVSGGISTCDCVQAPAVSCGCVAGKCTWWK